VGFWKLSRHYLCGSSKARKHYSGDLLNGCKLGVGIWDQYEIVCAYHSDNTCTNQLRALKYVIRMIAVLAHKHGISRRERIVEHLECNLHALIIVTHPMPCGSITCASFEQDKLTSRILITISNNTFFPNYDSTYNLLLQSHIAGPCYIMRRLPRHLGDHLRLCPVVP
jgi:hypothetical protein